LSQAGFIINKAARNSQRDAADPRRITMFLFYSIVVETLARLGQVNK
jgi:hypothetical protein